MSVRRLLALAAAAALVAAALASARCRGRPEGPNILLVTIETFRADHLGRKVGGVALTPNLDRLAARGTSFERAYAAASFTLPSLHTIATGEPPAVHGARFWTKFANLYREPTVAERMKDAGCTTGFVYSAYEELKRYWPVMARGWTEPPEQFYREDAPRVVAAAKAWLDRHGKEPFFLWVHLFEPHTPYGPGETFVEGLSKLDRYRSAGPAEFPVQDWIDKRPGAGADLADLLYAADIRAADAAVQQLLDALEERGLSGSTVVCVSSDHGENLAADPAPRWDHGVSADEQLLRVPLIFAGPGIPQGATRADIARHLDLAPTLLAKAHVGVPPQWAGRDLFGGAPAPRFAIGECTVDEDRDAPMYSVTDGSTSLRIWTHPAPWRVELRDETNRGAPAVGVNLGDPSPAAKPFVDAWKEADAFARRRAPDVNAPGDPGAGLTPDQIELSKMPPYVGSRKR